MTTRPRAPRSGALIATICTLASALATAPPARAADPGANGLIAWEKHDETGSHIWTMRKEAVFPKEVGPGKYPAWSPDGSRLVFSVEAGLTIVDADGANPTTLDLPGAAWATWKPDGTQLAFARYDDAALNWEIYVADVDGGGVVNLTNHPDEDIQPSWSPDGSRIAWRTNRNGIAEIHTMHPDGSTVVNLSNGVASGDPDWAPDGARIA